MMKIGVIGMGKLGLCLALNLERSGFNVVGIDKDEERVQSIQEKNLKTSEPDVQHLLKSANNLAVSRDLSDVISDDIETLFIVVPTPSKQDGSFSHAVIDKVIDDLEKLGRANERKTLVINSTTMPGYCDSIVQRLDALNYDLVYNPEFIAQGSIIRDQRHPDQVLIGAQNETSIDKVMSVYNVMCQNSPTYSVMDLQSAEMSKLATNCFLTMKISFANHLGDLAIKVGADPEKILASVGADDRIGSKYLKYGFGYGGPCFPRDNKAFEFFGKANDHLLHLSKATDQINEEHFQYQLSMLKSANREEYYFDDVAYKPGTDIIEESQQLRLALALANDGATVRVKASMELQESIEAQFGNVFQYVLD